MALYKTEFELGLLGSSLVHGSMLHASKGFFGIHASIIVPPQLDSIRPKI